MPEYELPVPIHSSADASSVLCFSSRRLQPSHRIPILHLDIFLNVPSIEICSELLLVFIIIISFINSSQRRYPIPVASIFSRYHESLGVSTSRFYSKKSEPTNWASALELSSFSGLDLDCGFATVHVQSSSSYLLPPTYSFCLHFIFYSAKIITNFTLTLHLFT